MPRAARSFAVAPVLRWFAPPVVLVLLLASPAAGQDRESPRKKIIVWGGIDWYDPAKVQSNIRAIEELPFDGTVLQGFTAKRGGGQVRFDAQCFGNERFDREELAATIATLKNIDFQRFTDNFLRYNVTPGTVDWFDDFAAILHNARMWAAVTKEVGAKGWMFDVEDYRGTVFSYQRMKYREQKSFDEYARQVRHRGGEFMQAVQAGNPEIVILLCLAHSYVNRTARAGVRLAEIEYGLLPAFLNGMFETAGAGVRIVDGHEQGYGYLTPEAFYRGYHATRQGALALVPPELHGAYRAKMEAGMAVFANYSLGLTDYPGHWPVHYLTPEERLRVFEQNVYYGLAASDEYLWLYSEHMGWWEKGWNYPTPAGALEAVRSARARIGANQPLGFHVSADRIATAEATLQAANPFPARDSTVARIGMQVPKIDGLLDEAAWKDAPLLLPFSPLPSQSNATTHTTQSQALFDEQHLYFAFRCNVTSGAQLESAGEKTDDKLAKGDCIDVYLRAGEHQLPFHFAVNPQNTRWDGRGDFSEWNGRWQSGCRITDKQWTAEIAIPWATVGGRPSSGRSLRAFFRRRHAASDEWTAVVQELGGLASPKE